MNKKKLRKGEGRVQLIACRDKLEELEAAGYGPVAIYERLKEQNMITLSYGGFYEAYRYADVRKKRRIRAKGGRGVQNLAVNQATAVMPTNSASTAHQKQAPVHQESSPPIGNIVDLGSDLNENAARHQAYQERQAAADEDQASLNENIEKYIGK